MRKSKFNIFKRRYFFRNKKFIIFVLLGVGIFFLVRYLKQTDKFVIASYQYSGVVKFVNSSDFESVIDANIKNQNFFSFKPRALENTIKKNFLATKTVRVFKKFPSALEIQVQERVPIAVVTDVEQVKYIIDEDGYVLGLIEDAYFDLPVVNYDKKLFVGQFVDTNVVPIAIEILNSAKVENVKISSISFKPEYSTFYSGSTIIYVNNADKIKESLKVLSRLLVKSEAAGKKLSKVDLRYDKVIVSYE